MTAIWCWAAERFFPANIVTLFAMRCILGQLAHTVYCIQKRFMLKWYVDETIETCFIFA